ncbi:superoxide dismutase [Cu-Zn]-like [Dermacentor silvarum]|uniref:superoxide dismutase [Cu-Zn]-like n=1 Tax=Dermacentor silvarum TaxID=543639 RepID=UPI002100D08D|nr:superoxide dismutase [Cu-Zn]-like [Dermacentor silvarum]
MKGVASGEAPKRLTLPSWGACLSVSSVSDTVAVWATLMKGPASMGNNPRMRPADSGRNTINESGNVTDNCDAVGAHFNPYGKEHGPATSGNSHLGDLGNVDASDDLIAQVQITSRRLHLYGNDSIVSRSCVVYERPDDYGAKGDVVSKSTGNMGDHVGCGLIRGFGKHAASSAAAFVLPLLLSPLGAAFVLSPCPF